MKKRYSNEQIIGFLKQAAAGAPIKELCRKHGFSDASFYLWRRGFGGMDVPDAKRLRELAAENGKLKKLLAKALLDKETLTMSSKGNSRPAGQARSGSGGHPLSERRICQLLGLSRSVLHYAFQRRADGLQARLIELAGERRPVPTGRSLDQWAQANGVKLLLIQPGKPTQNAYVESFNGKSRDKYLNENWVVSLDHARAMIFEWRMTTRGKATQLPGKTNAGGVRSHPAGPRNPCKQPSER